MRGLLLVATCSTLFAALQTTRAAGTPATIAGTYDILVCKGPCSFERQAKVIIKGRLILFATALAKADLQRFDENRFSHLHGEAINGCFTLDTLGATSSYAGIEKIGLTSWSKEDGHYRFSLYHSPDAGYEVTVKPTRLGLAGTGTSWGAGAAAPDSPSTEIVIARRTGGADISRCTFQTANEHEFRRILADPARSDVFALEQAYEKQLTSDLLASTLPRDWAMAGWMQNYAEGEAMVLRARAAAPTDALILWMTVVRTHANEVPVVQDDTSQGVTLQYRELSSSALAELQRAEPGNAILWLMSLRNAVDQDDTPATDAALAHLASSAYYDDHAAELLRAQLELLQHHPLPSEFFDAVARLDPAWRLNGEFTRDVAPYYENQYPFADIGITNLFFMPVESGIGELYRVCVLQAHPSATRKGACVKTGRLLAARARRVDVREAGSMLLSQINDFVGDDVRRARVQAWIQLQFHLIRPPNSGSQRPFVRKEVAFINDWIESSDEFEAMKRAVTRAGAPLEPPEDFRLKEAAYGNFERTRADGHAQTE